MTAEWERYWRLKAAEYRRTARSLRDKGFPEVADSYDEDAETIEVRFTADAEITVPMEEVDEPAVAVPEDPGTKWEGITELEERYLHGDK